MKYSHTEVKKDPGAQDTRPRIDTLDIVYYFDGDYINADYLGEFTDDADIDDLKRGNAFNYRREHGDRNSFKYFVCEYKVEDRRKDLQRRGYSRQAAEEEARRQCRQDYDRMVKIGNGDICFYGIQAKALISYPAGYVNGSGRPTEDRRLETFTSGGLWGIESDSGEDYTQEIEQNELEDLKSHLEQFNINTDAFKYVDQEGEEVTTHGCDIASKRRVYDRSDGPPA